MTPGWANKKIRKEIEGEASNQNEPQHAPCAIYIYIFQELLRPDQQKWPVATSTKAALHIKEKFL